MRKIPVPAAAERVLDTALDTALAVQRPFVLTYLDRARTRPVGATPADVVARLERRYLTAVVGIGAASGGAAAVPGIGTATSVAAGAAEITAFVSATGLYVLALSELHAVPVSDPQIRRALVLGVLVGSSGRRALQAAGAGEVRWAQVLNRADRKDTIAGMNHRLAHLMITRFGARQGALLVGRALPLGVGAGVGAAGNAVLARSAITAARRAFGPPPSEFPPRVIDAGPPRALRGTIGG